MSTASTILIVDDNAEVRSVFRAALEQAGYRVTECSDGAEALAALRRDRPAAMVLDVDMPEKDGWRTLAEVRQSGWVQPVLMVTHVGDIDSRVRGLEGGADDYVQKPCSAPELVARVRALLRRVPIVPAPPNARLRLGDVLIDLEKKVALQDGTVTRLTRTECALIEILSRTPGVPVDREELFRQVWGAKPGRSHTLDTHIWRLRRKIGDTGEKPRWLLNHPGVGFVMASEMVAEPPGS